MPTSELHNLVLLILRHKHMNECFACRLRKRVTLLVVLLEASNRWLFSENSLKHNSGVAERMISFL